MWQKVQIAKKSDMQGEQFPTIGVITFAGTVSDAAQGFSSNKVIVTNLEENTEYVYRLGDGNEDNWSDIYNYTTKGTGSYSFLFVGDPQIGSNIATTLQVGIIR